MYKFHLFHLVHTGDDDESKSVSGEGIAGMDAPLFKNKCIHIEN